ncbi:Tetratricopeptide repeat protein 14 [Branchiostoma belcheri]|nr:Tetratricopeptide repeat protein 14 [Branchiostoma belcheri]
MLLRRAAGTYSWFIARQFGTCTLRHLHTPASGQFGTMLRTVRHYNDRMLLLIAEPCRTVLAAWCRTILGQVPNRPGKGTEPFLARCRTVLDGAEVSRCRSVQSNTDVSKYAEELSKDPTVLRSANSISRLFKGGSKNNVTTIFAKNLIESATEDLQIEIESCSSMSSGSCESGMDMMDSVLNITGLIHAEKNRIKGERSREDVGLLSQIAKFKPEFRATTETHQRESTHELTHRRDSQGHDTMAYLHKGYSLTRLSDLRQGKIRTVTGKTLRIKCSKENEILRQKMIYNARQELAPPKKKKFKTVAKAVAWTVRNRLAFMKGDQKTKEQEEEEKLQKLAKITVRNVIKNAVKKLELEKRKEAIREERRRRANRRKITKTPNYFGELEDFPDPTPWVQKYDKNHNKDNKALTYLVREIQRDIKENELGPPRPGLELPCTNLSEEEPTILSGRKNSTIHFGDITKIEDSDSSQVREEDKLSIAAGGAPAEPQTLKPALKPSKTDIPRTGKESTSKPDYLGGKSGSSSVTREAKGAGMIGLFPATDIPSSKKSPKSGGILKDDKKKGVKGSVQKGQGTEMSPALTDETRTQARQSSSQDAEVTISSAAADEPVPIWTKAPKEKKSWTSQDKPRDMTDPRVDAPYMLRSLTEVRSGKSAEEMEEPPPAPRSSECLIKGVEGLSSSSGSSGGTPDAEPVGKMPTQRQAGLPKEGARVRATAVADSGAVVPYSADDGVRTAVQKITVAVTEGMMATNPHLRILNRAVSIVDPVMQATEAMLFHPTLLGDLIHQVNHTYNTVEATTLGLTRYFTAIMSGVLTRVAGLMPLIGATEEDGLPTLPSNAPVDRTDTATSTGKRLMAIKASPPPSESGVTDQKGTAEQSRRKNKLSKGRYPVRGESPGIKESVPTANMPRKSSIPCMERDQVKPHTAAQGRKTGKPDSTEGVKKRSEIKQSPPKEKKTEKSESQEAEGIIWKVPDRRRRSSLHPEVVKDLKSTLQHREEGHQKKTTDKSDSQEAEGTIWKVPDRRRRSSLNPEVVKDLKNTLRHREEERQEKKPTLHFTSESSAVSQKSTVTKYGKGKKKDTTSQETSQALTKTTLAFAPPPPPPPLPGCLPGGSKPAKAAPVVYTTQTAEVEQRAAVSSREEDGTEISTETATMATMMEAQFSGDESDDETLKEQAPQQESATVFLPPKYLDRFQSQGWRHVEFRPSPRSSAASSVAGSAPSSRASSPANTPRSASPVNRDHAGQGVQSAALAAALRDVGDNRHGMMQPRRDSLAFQIHSQATKLKHSTTVRRKTSTGETEDTAETSHMVATVQAGRIPSPPPLPSFSLGLSAHPALAMSPLSPMTLGQALHDAIGRREQAAPGHVPSSSPEKDSLSFRLQSQATKLKHSTTVRRKTSTGETEDTNEASQMVATVEASRVPTPPPLPPLGLGAHSQIAPPAALAIASPAPTMGLPSASPLPQFGGLGGLTSHGLTGGTAMRHTSTSAKVTQKTSVKKGDETVENVAEASQTMATMEAGHIPAPPPLPTREQLRRASLAQAVVQPRVHGVGFGRVPSPPALPPMELLMSGISHGPGLAPPPPALPPMKLLMSGISHGFGGVSQPPQTAMLSPGQGQGGGTFMRSTTASNKMTHKTKVTKGDETVENVAEASETLATMEAGHIPAPPPLPTREQLRRASLAQAVVQPRVHGVGFGRVPSPPALPPMELLMSGISHGSGLVPSPPALPPMELLMSGISHGPGLVPSPPALPPMELLMSGISHGFGGVTQPPPTSMLSPGHGKGGDTFMRSTTASNKMTHKTKVTKGDETVENVAEAGQTVASMEAGHIPAPPPLPTPEQLRRFSLAQAVHQPNMALQLAGHSALAIPQSPPSLMTPGQGQGGGTFMRSTTASNKMTHKTKVTKGDETVENVAEASETLATLEAGHIPAPPPLPTREQLRRASLAQAVVHPRVHGVGFGRVPLPPALPPMELLMSGISRESGLVPPPPALPPMELLMSGISHGSGLVPSPPALPPMELLMSGISHGSGLAPPPPALPPMELLMSGISHGFGGVTQPPPSSMFSPGHGQGGGTFMRSTAASNKMTHKTKVTKGDETVENVAEASETLATMEAGHIPAPPPLPTPEQLRRFSLAQAVPQPNMALQMTGPSGLAIPQSPPSLMTPGQGQGGGTFMRSTTASNKLTHKTKVTKGDETVENVAEASETLATMEAGHIPAPPPLPTREQLRRASLAQAVIHPRVHGVGFGRVPSPPALPPMELLMSGISHEPGLIPSPPALPPMELLMSGISHGPGLAPPPPALPPMELLMSGISHGFGGVTQPPPTSMLSPGQGQGGGTFMRSTTASNKVTHKTKVTKGDETVENVAEASETLATMEAGHIPAPPPLPTREQLRRASLAQAVIHPRVNGVGFGRVPSPPALPPMELLMSGISHGSGLVPSPPALPPMELLMSGISHEFVRVPSPPPLPPPELLISEISFESRRVPNPPALPPMELLMSGISGFPGQEVSQALPGPLLDLVGAGARQPVPDPNRQYTVMTMYSTQGSNLPQKKARHDEGDGHGLRDVGVGAKTTKIRKNIPDPPPLPEMKFFVPKPYVQHKGTFGHEIAQKVDRLTQRREMSIELNIARRDSTDLLLAIEENASKFSPEEVEEMRKEANEDIAKIDECLNQLLMSTSLRNLVEDSGSVVEDSGSVVEDSGSVVEDSGSVCSEELLPVSTDDSQTDPLAIQSDSQLTVHLHRQSDDSQSTEQHQLKLCQHADHGESAWHQRGNHYQVVHGEKTSCCLADHAQNWSYKPPRFKCGSCDETLLMKFHLETDSEGEDEEDEGHTKVPVPICHTKKHQHDHTWTYDPPRMTCKSCHVKAVLKMHLKSDEEDEDPAERPVPIYHRSPRKDPRTHPRLIQSRSDNKASQIPLVRKPSKTSERKYPYRQPGEKAYSTPQASSRKLPEPKVIVRPEMRRQPAAEAVSVSGAAESSARQGRTPPENVDTRTTDGTSPPESTAAKADKQSVKGSAEPAAQTQKGTVKGGKREKTQKEYSQKVWEALVGDDNERDSPKTKATPPNDAKKPSTASKDAGAKSTQKGAKAPKAGQTGDQTAKLTPTKIPQPIKDTAVKRKVPVMGTTALSAKRTEVRSTDKTSVTQAAHPPTKIPQPIKDTGVKRKVPVMGTTALSAKRIDMQAEDKPAAHPPTKIPQPIKETDVQRKVPVMGTTALYAKRTEMQSTDKTSVTQAAHPPTKIPQPIKETDVKRKTLSAKRADMQTEDKQAAHPPTKIPQQIQVTAVRRKTPVMGTTALSARRADMQTAGKQTAHPPTKIPQPIPIQVTAVKRETPVVRTTALSARRTEEPKGVQTRPASMKTTRPAKDSADRPNTPLKESATAGPSSAQTGPASVKSTQPANDSADTPRTPQKESAAARPSSAQTTPTAGQFRAQTEYKPPERKRPDAWVSSGIKKYTDEERAKLDAEVDEYWGKRFSKDREKPWWNIEDPEERERARLRQDRSKTDLRRTGSGVAAASYKRPGIQEQVKYGGGVDRSPVMLPGHYGAATGVSRASRPGTGLVPKKLEMEFFDSSEDSEDEIDLDKPISKEDLHDDEYWMAMEKKAYAMVKASMEQLETGQLEMVDEESSVDEKKVQGASPTVKKPSKFARMFQSRKEREQKIDREAREMAMKQQAAKKLDTVEHKSDPPNGKPVYGPPLPPEMQREQEKKKGLTRYGHKGVTTLATMKSKEKEPSTSQKSGGKLTPTKLVGKIKGGFTRVKDSIRSRLSGEESDTRRQQGVGPGRPMQVSGLVSRSREIRPLREQDGLIAIENLEYDPEADQPLQAWNLTTCVSNSTILSLRTDVTVMEFRHVPQGAPMSPPTLAHLVDTAIMDVSADFHGNSLRSRIQEEFGFIQNTTQGILYHLRYQPDRVSDCPKGDLREGWDRRPGQYTFRTPAIPLVITRAGTPVLNVIAAQQRIESFIVRKADVLFQTRPASHRHQAQAGKDEEDYYAVLPPLEQFMGVPMLPAKDRFYKMVQPGDTVVGKIVSMKDFGFFVKLLCLTGGAARDVQDMDITALCLSSDLPSHGAHQRPIDYYHTNDLIQAVVKTVSVVDDRIVISLLHNHSPQPLPQVYLGIITSDDLPVHFRRSQDLQTSQTSYDDLLQRVWGFSNPSNVSYLGGVLDIADKHPPSLMRGLHRCPFPQTDFAESLRQQQSSKWALACVGTGVQHFKSGRHVEAMQCLEKALTFDPANVEALVVRGALYANKNSLLRAMEDFAQALKLNPGHNNARKYMCETLLARGKQLQEEGEDEDAMTSYQRALVINPDLQEAKDALEQVRTKLENMKTASQVDMTSGGEELPAELSFAQRSKEKLQKLLDVEGSSKDKSGLV